MKTVITVTVEHHPATKALSRILALLDLSKDGYGVDALEYAVDGELTPKADMSPGDEYFAIRATKAHPRGLLWAGRTSGGWAIQFRSFRFSFIRWNS